MSFSFLDWFILVVYLGGVVAIGAAFSGRQHSSEEFFLGGRRFGGFTMSLSLLGSSLSAITFLGVPGYVYGKDWSLFFSGAMAVFSILVVARVFVPYFYHSRCTSVYEYLEQRFDARAASFAAILFLLMRGLLAGLAIYTPSLALSTVTGWSLTACILLSGVTTLAYTTLGGMSAVVWTDILQLVVLFGGAGFALVRLCLKVPGTPAEWFVTLSENQKWNLFDLEWSWVRLTLWGSIFGGFVFCLASYGIDQVMVQRYMASKSLAAARKSLYLNAWYLIPVNLIFLFLGSMLYLFGRSHPGAFPGSLQPDQVLPFYIVHYMPHGMAGLVIAGVFAAAMSTLSAVLNSLATVSVSDFYRRFFRPVETEEHYARAGRVFTLLWGFVAIGMAFLCRNFSSGVALAAVKAAGLFLGPILGIFLLGMFTRRATASSAFWAGVLGLAATLLTGLASPLEEFWLCILGTALTVAASFLLNAIRPRPALETASPRPAQQTSLP